MKTTNERFDILCIALEDIRDEVARAVNLHGPIHSLHEAHSVIEEEFDEFWEQVKINPRKLYEDDQKVRLRKIREELIQVAAMCVRTIIDLNI